MSFDRLLAGRTCTIRHVVEGDADAHGNPTLTVTETVVPCYLDPRRSERQPRATSDDQEWLGVFHAGTAIDANDEVEADGTVFEVINLPMPVHNPRLGQFAHVEVTLKRTS